MEPRFVELLVRGGVVTRDQLSEAQKKELLTRIGLELFLYILDF